MDGSIHSSADTPNGSVDLFNPNDNRVIKVNGQRVKPYVVQQTVREEILLLDPP